jgi:putative phosphoribosyl transferase
VFADRVDAGRQLAAAVIATLPEAGPEPKPVVLGLPRGGVVVAAEVATALHAPLDVIVVRKLRAPGRPELAIGAIGEDGSRVLDETIMRRVGVGAGRLVEIERQERTALEERARRLRGVRPRVELTGRTAVVVDDGIATGATARVACRVARHLGAAAVVIAAPVAAASTVRAILVSGDADDVVTVARPESFSAVGAHYIDFAEVPEERVAEMLARSP